MPSNWWSAWELTKQRLILTSIVIDSIHPLIHHYPTRFPLVQLLIFPSNLFTNDHHRIIICGVLSCPCLDCSIFFSGRNKLVLCSSTHEHNGNDRQYQYANHTMPRPLRCSSIIKCPYYSQTKATFIVLATLFHHPTPQAPPQPWDRNRTLLPPLFFSELEHCWLRDELEQHKHSAQTLSWDSHL